MCNKACLDFGANYFTEQDIKGKKIIEVGARDVNGSLRTIVEHYEPEEYVGVDIEAGPGVDEICNVENLVEHFGTESFDVLVSTEMLEHVRDWRKAFSQIKRILKTGGVLVITTRSKGFPYHDYPIDFWRFELSDMQEIFSDMKIEALESDPIAPGVFVKARRPENFTENDLGDYALYSMVKAAKSKEIEFNSLDMLRLKIRNSYVPRKLRSVSKKIFSS